MKNLKKIFNAVSDINRLRIIKLLHSRKMCVCEITAVLKLAQSTVSSHLKILINAGFINARQKGKWVEYYLVPSSKRDYLVKNMLNLILSYGNNDEIVVRDRKKAEKVNRYEVCKTNN